jgi:hypothetical protein
MLLGCAKPGVFVGHCAFPLGGANDVVGVVTHFGQKFLIAGTDSNDHCLGIEVQFFGCTHKEQCVVEVTTTHKDVRFHGLELAHNAAHIGHIFRIALYPQHFHAIFGCPFLCARGHTGGESGVFIGNHNRCSTLFGQHFQGRFRVITRGREDGEKILKTP